MKKQGFTLAEVLITLGIIGVVAALTLPAVNMSTSNAKIGPSLATAAGSFSSAAKALLKDAESDYMSSAVTNETKATELFNSVGKYLSGHRVNGNPSDTFVMDNGTSFFFGAEPKILKTNNAGSDGAAQHDIYMTDFVIDINGDQGPNTNAKDRFWFYIMEDGSLVPYGVDNSGPTYNITTVAPDNAYTVKCPNGQNPSATGHDAKYCAASIFANKLKVEYKN